MLKVNFDTGNSYLAGSDPYRDLEAVADRVVHVHAKDVGGILLDEVGKVTGTPVGVACGEGVIDWRRIIEILQRHNYRGVLSVECGTVAQARTSFAHLHSLIQPSEALAR
jgi:sugar phosphate isomerase/epimerase